MFSLVNTRLILRTGVDLGAIGASQDADSALIQRVLKELQAMGYSPQALDTVARRSK